MLRNNKDRNITARIADTVIQSTHIYLTPGSFNSKIVFIAGLAFMTLVLTADMVTTSDLSLHGLYVFPLAAIAFHCEQRWMVLIGLILSILFQVMNFVVYRGYFDSLAIDIIISFSCSALAIILATVARGRSLSEASAKQELHTLVENTPDTIARYDLDCRRTYVNTAFGKLVDGGVEALLGKKPSEIPGGHNSEIYEAKIKEVIATNRTCNFELFWQAKDGKELCSHIQLTPEWNLSGNMTSILGVGRDITQLNNFRRDIMRTEATMRSLEERLRMSQTIGGVGIWEHSLTTGEYYWSDVALKILGLTTVTDPNFRDFLSVVHPADREYVSASYRSHIDIGDTFEISCRIFDSNEKLCWIRYVAKSEFDRHGKPFRIRGILQDVTSIKTMEMTLKQTNDRIHAYVEQAADALLIYDESGTIIDANQEACKNLGYTKAELMRMNVVDVCSDSDPATTWNVWHQVSPGEHRTFQTTQLRKDKSIFPVEVRLGCFDLNEQRLFLAVARDITKRLETEETLRAAFQLLEDKERSKTRFLAAAGHDMRQPLAAANLFIDSLKLTTLTTDQAQIVGRIDQALSNFNELLGSLLDISKLDSGAIKPDYRLISVTDVFKYLEENYSVLASNKNIRFKFYYPMAKTLAIRSDIGLLQSVLMNLVGNAIKFTVTGGVLVSVRRRADDLLFQVWDTGIGIKNEEIDNIFEEFYQIDNTQRDRANGLGLGLSIVQRALSLLGGEIKCSSRIGKGSVFGFSLPLYLYPVDKLERISSPATEAIICPVTFFSGKRIVVVENDVLVAEALVNALERSGGVVNLFSNAEAGLSDSCILQADYFIVDFMLDGNISGSEMLNMLGRKCGRRVNGVLVTSDTSPAFAHQAINCPWPILHKPFNISTLISHILQPCEAQRTSTG
ncbi:MAG: PAS domain S-box protein [Gallionella sp.]